MRVHLSRFWAWPEWYIKGRRSIVLFSLSASLALSAHLLSVRLLPGSWQASRSADFRTYYEPVAARVASGEGLYLPSGKPAVRYPPGIPLIYGATFWTSHKLGISRALGMRLLQGILVAAAAVLVAAISVVIFPARVALLTSLLWSTYPLQLWLTKQPSGMNAFSVLLLLSVLLFLRWSRHGSYPVFYGTVVGASLAVTSLVKPFAIALPAVFGVLAWSCSVPCPWRKRAIFSGCVLLMYMLVISPWELWAWQATGHWLPLCKGGPSAMVDGLSFGLARRGASELPLPDDVRSVARDVAMHADQFTNSKRVVQFLGMEAREKPVAVVHLFLIKAIRSWYGNDSHTHEKWIVLVQFLYLPVILLGGRLAWNADIQRRNFLLVAGTVTLYYWAMTTIVALAIVRYMLPASALLMILAGIGLEAVADQCWIMFSSRLRPTPYRV